MNARPSHSAMEVVIVEYLAHQRALGRAYDTEERVLVSLNEFLVQNRALDLDRSHFEAWCHTHSRLTANVRRMRQRIVRNFCLYRRRSDPECFVPDLHAAPQPQPYCAPILVEPQQIARMLELATGLAPTSGSPLRPVVMRLAIVLLYTAGLRRGELLRLTPADVEPQTGVLRIRESKFHRSRLVPLSAGASAELRRYLRQRLKPPFDPGEMTPLLCNWARGRLRPYTGTGLSQGIHSLFDAAGVCDAEGRRPRIHDLSYPNLNKIQTFITDD